MMKMILEQLMEKKDLIIYIDLRVKQLKKTRKIAMERITDKKKELMYRKFSGRITELLDLKNLINSGQLKSKSKYLWKTHGIPKLAKSGIITNPSAIGFPDGCTPLTQKQCDELDKTKGVNIVDGYSTLTEEQSKQFSEELEKIFVPLIFEDKEIGKIDISEPFVEKVRTVIPTKRKNLMKLECNECDSHCRYEFEHEDSQGIIIMPENIGCIKMKENVAKWRVISL